MTTTAGHTQPARRDFMAWLNDEASMETVRQAARIAGLPDDGVLSGGIAAALEFVASHSAPASLVVDVSGCQNVLEAMDRLADACEPDTLVVAIGTVNDVDTYRKLLDLGVTDYIVKPSTPDAIAHALNRMRRSRPVQPDKGTKPHRSVAVIGARGGCGATSVAVAVACALAHEHELRTLLVDLDLHLGSAAMSLDLEPSKGLREILSNADRIDSLLIKSALVRESDRLSLLSGEEPLDSQLEVDGDALRSLLKWAEEDQDSVVIDVSRRLDGLSRTALDTCGVVCLVTDLSLPGMRDSKRILALLELLNPECRILVVANRVGGVPGELPQSEFERGLGAKIDVVLPFDAKASAMAADQGKSLLSVAPAGALSSELERLVNAIAGTESEPTRAAARSWLGRFVRT